ncbi:outer membrane protein transport protein [candidate division WOR-3 bacterium]|nr:outer membrane protein transport protein [candidate division WOR-3 bacterium]
MFNSLVILILISSWNSYFLNDSGARTMGLGGGLMPAINELESTSFNPAGLTQIDNLLVSIGCKLTDGEVYFWSEPDRILFKTSEFLPTFVGVAFPIRENSNLCISLSIPYKKRQTSDWFKETTPIHPEGTGRYYRIIESKRFYALNTSFAWKLKENLSVGIGLSWLLEQYRSSLQFRNNNTYNHDWIQSQQMGIEMILGLLYEINNSFKVGTSLRKGFVRGHYNQTYMKAKSENKLINFTKQTSEMPEEETLPLMVSLGLGYQVSRRLLLNFSLEFIGWSGVSHKLNGKPDIPDYLKDVLRLHYSAEYKLSTIALRIGLYTDPYLFEADAKRDQVFLTAGLGFEFKSIILDLAATSSRLIVPSEKRENNYLLSLTYKGF